MRHTFLLIIVPFLSISNNIMFFLLKLRDFILYLPHVSTCHMHVNSPYPRSDVQAAVLFASSAVIHWYFNVYPNEQIEDGTTAEDTIGQRARIWPEWNSMDGIKLSTNKVSAYIHAISLAYIQLPTLSY